MEGSKCSKLLLRAALRDKQIRQHLDVAEAAARLAVSTYTRLAYLAVKELWKPKEQVKAGIRLHSLMAYWRTVHMATHNLVALEYSLMSYVL